MNNVEEPKRRVTKAEEKAYYESAGDWFNDRIAALEKSRRVAWWMAGTFGAFAGTIALSLLLLIPLKKVEPWVVFIEDSGGIVVQRVIDSTVSQNELLARYFLRRYVVLRESYTREQLEPNFDQLILFTDAKLRIGLQNEFKPTSDTSPFKRYGENGTAQVKIKTVSFLRLNIAVIRYDVVEKVSGVEAGRKHMQATIEFKYVAPPTNEETRGVNPLGFIVTSWRADVETVPKDEDGRKS